MAAERERRFPQNLSSNLPLPSDTPLLLRLRHAKDSVVKRSERGHEPFPRLRDDPRDSWYSIEVGIEAYDLGDLMNLHGCRVDRIAR